MRENSTERPLFGAAAIAAALILALGACSDSDGDSKDAGGTPADQAVTPDPDKGGGGTDQGGGGDQGGEVDAGATGLSCNARQLCTGCCAESDDECQDACEAAMSEDAKKAWADLYACGSTACTGCGSDEACTACVEEKCGPEHDACDWGAAGGAACAQTQTCIEACPQLKVDRSGSAETCPTDPGIVCFQACMIDAAPAAAAAAYDVLYCQYTKCSESCLTAGKEAECDTCMTDNCGEAMTACEAP